MKKVRGDRMGGGGEAGTGWGGATTPVQANHVDGVR